MPPDENNPPAPEIPEADPLPPENPTPPAPPAAPPAAKLVTGGEVQNERLLALEKRLTEAEEGRRKAEFIAAEKERENQELKKIPAAPGKIKPAKSMFRPIIGADDDDE